ncbi:MAG TPA: SAM-dependent methyltransferase [Thermoanaerobaculia bacterium]|jgi:SAM-dependent MidA family methyltransferase
MPAERSLIDVLRNTLQYGDLPFRDFVELALYHPEFGYYARAENPVDREGDYVTAPVLSPAFAFAIAGLVREFASRNEGVVCSFVDIGCGDGSLVRAVAEQVPHVRCFGVDRALGRAGSDERFIREFAQVPRDGAHLLFSNELFDAFPFARLVQRGEHLHELWVTERDGALDWSEREAAPDYEHYFAERGIELADGQFADVSPEWAAFYEELARFSEHALLVTLDYGFEQRKLFGARLRRFGTAAAYRDQRVSRDLLASPGMQDLTAHINFTDLERAGERAGAATLLFDRLASFLLSLGITEHELFRPAHEVELTLALSEARDDARRLVLPDGIGEEMRVLVQAKQQPRDGWSFQRKPY